MHKVIDVKEDFIFELSTSLLHILLKDQSTGENIIWATDDYSEMGDGYKKKDQLSVYSITGKNNLVIRPRVSKSKDEQVLRIRNNAEVFTPSWVCNEQNNLIDEQWFGTKSPFNNSVYKRWETNYKKISFNECNKTWIDYVKDTRLEITCGEAPYITSRYDTVTGEYIEVKDRIGLLDRKLRVISENTTSKEEWIKYSILALKNIYGFEFQGDNLLIARENVLMTVIEHYKDLYNEIPTIECLCVFAEIISWNLWQMDGLKYVVPYSCHNEDIIDYTLFGDEIIKQECPGCKRNAITKHNGIYCRIKDWEKGKNVKYLNLVTRGKRV